MDFDQLLIRFFGTDDITTLAPERLAGGVAALRLQFGFEKDEDERVALWCLMFMLGIEPNVEEAFQGEDDRKAAREFMAEAEREMERTSKCCDLGRCVHLRLWRHVDRTSCTDRWSFSPASDTALDC